MLVLRHGTNYLVPLHPCHLLNLDSGYRKQFAFSTQPRRITRTFSRSSMVRLYFLCSQHRFNISIRLRMNFASNATPLANLMFPLMCTGALRHRGTHIQALMRACAAVERQISSKLRHWRPYRTSATANDQGLWCPKESCFHSQRYIWIRSKSWRCYSKSRRRGRDPILLCFLCYPLMIPPSGYRRKVIGPLSSGGVSNRKWYPEQYECQRGRDYVTF